MTLEADRAIAGHTTSSATENLILTEAETAELTRLSTRTLQRLAEDGRGPPRIQLTERRIGYWRGGTIAWLKARTAPSKHAA